jgi:hypothetical protein
VLLPRLACFQRDIGCGQQRHWPPTVTDLHRVVHYRVFEHGLVLELDSGDGVMYFDPFSPGL